MRGAPPATASPTTPSRSCSSSRATRRRADPSVRALAEHADAVIGIGMFEESFRGIADLVLPGTSYLERDGTTVNLEGRLQRQRRAVLAPVPGRARLALEARRAVRRRALAARLGRLRRDLGEVLRRHLLRRRRRARVAAARAAEEAPASRTQARTPAARRRGPCASSPTGRSSRAPPSSERPSSQFQRPERGGLARAGRRDGSAASATAHRHGLARTGRRSSCARESRATSPPAPCASPRPRRGTCTRRSR